MIKRLIVGLLLGLVIGAIVAGVLVQGLGVSSFAVSGSVVAYLAAAVTGVLAGLITGKPIWSADGKIEAGLKAFFGALLAVGGMFALRTWAQLDLDLSVVKGGHGYVGDLPAASLPVIAALLGAFFELDNTESGAKANATESGRAPVSTGAGRNVRVSAGREEEKEEDLEEPPAKRKAR